MVRATVSFKTPEGVSEGWLIDFPTIPRIGEEIVLLTHDGEELRRGRVGNVRHLASGTGHTFRAAAMQLEIEIE